MKRLHLKESSMKLDCKTVVRESEQLSIIYKIFKKVSYLSFTHTHTHTHTNETYGVLAFVMTFFFFSFHLVPLKPSIKSNRSIIVFLKTQFLNTTLANATRNRRSQCSIDYSFKDRNSAMKNGGCVTNLKKYSQL